MPKPSVKPSPLTNADLSRQFRLYNDRYFGGNLNLLEICFRKLPAGAIGHSPSYRQLFKRGPDSYAIHLDVSLKTRGVLADATLLHEMVHVELNCAGLKHDCGKGKTVAHQRFYRRMLKLAEQGAFNGLW